MTTIGVVNKVAVINGIRMLVKSNPNITRARHIGYLHELPEALE